MYDFIDTLNESRSLSESLGKLNTGTSEFREVVKALLKMKTDTGVSPNSNIVNFTVSDIGDVPSKVMQIAATTDELPAAIYLANAEGKGMIVFEKYGSAFTGKITKTTPVGVLTRDNSPWGQNGFGMKYTQRTGRRNHKDIRFRDVGMYDMRGEISGAVIFADSNKDQLRQDRRQAQHNADPLSMTRSGREWDRSKRLDAYKASKGDNFTGGEISFKEFSDIIVSYHNKRGVNFNGIPVSVHISSRFEVPKNPMNDPVIEVAHLDAIAEGTDSTGRTYGRFSTLAKVYLDLSNGRYTIKPR